MLAVISGFKKTLHTVRALEDGNLEVVETQFQALLRESELVWPTIGALLEAQQCSPPSRDDTLAREGCAHTKCVSALKVLRPLARSMPAAMLSKLLASHLHVA